MEKEVIIFIHGFKTNDKNDFSNFVLKYESEFPNKEFVIFDYYKSNENKTIGVKKFDKKVDEVFKKYKDRKVKVISYSFGSVIAIKKSSYFDNVKDIYLNVPSFYIDYIKWAKDIRNFKIKNKKLKRKLGKERYLSLKKKMGADINFSRVSRKINKYINRNRKYTKKISDKNITIAYSNIDDISNNERIIPYLKNGLNKNNNVIYHEINEKHFDVLENKNNIKHIKNFINDKEYNNI